MPEKFKETINIPVAIPAWGLITILIGGVFTAGVTVQKLNTLIENYAKTEARVNTIQERQYNGLSAIANQQTQLNSHETRITNIERVISEKK